MLIPLLFVFGLAYVGLSIGRKLQPSDFRVGAALPAPRLPRVSYVAVVRQKLAHGHPVSDWMMCEATREAFDRGDWATVRQLSETFDVGIPAAPEKQEDETPQKPEAPTTSPLDGVEADDWQSFCKALETQTAGHKSGRYVGRFEQNQTRLRQLGIDTPTTAEDEYKALVLDMSNYWEDETKFIQDSSGEVVALSGQDHPVTPSGILGLLKAAGPQGARSWLGNAEDRERFPRTTETFLRTNGCF